MDTLDPAAEYLRLAGHYRQMSDEELLLLIPQRDELTPSAQQALASEVRHRGLKVEAKLEEKPFADSSFEGPKLRQESPPPDVHIDDSPDGDTAYEEERKLVELCTVWSLRDALKLQHILDVAGIPFFMGAEKATGVGKVTSNFANGVSVQIMQVGMPWAAPLLQNYFPEDDPAPQESKETDAPPIRCPRCNSEEGVFNGLTAAARSPSHNLSQKFQWTCDPAARPGKTTGWQARVVSRKAATESSAKETSGTQEGPADRRQRSA